MAEEPSVASEEDKSTIKITVKTHQRNEEFSVKADMKVSELKPIIAQRFDAETSQLCLIYAGRMLNDSSSLGEQNVKNGFAVHLVIRNNTQQQQQQSRTQPDANNETRGRQQQQQQQDNTQSPRISEMTAALLSNPSYIRTLISMDPRLQAYLEQHPEIAHAINNPNIMREYLQIASNPNMMQEFLRNQDLSMRNLESVPGGMAALESLYNNLSELELPLRQTSQPAAASEGQPERRAAENSTPLPNPWSAEAPGNNDNASGTLPGAMPNAESMSQLLSNPDVQQLMLDLARNPAFLENVVSNSPLSTRPSLRDFLASNLPQVLEHLSAAGGGGIANNAEGLQQYMQESSEVLYASQLDQLSSMGFTDRAANLAALTNTFGDINAAIDLLTHQADR